MSACAEKADQEPLKEGYGRLAFATRADASIDGGEATTTPTTDQFTLRITGGENYDKSWTTIAAFVAENPMLMSGHYTAFVTHGSKTAEGGEAYYEGSQEFELLARQTTYVTITASVANSQVLVRATEQFLQYFHDAEFTVTTGAGNTFTFTPGATPADEAVFVQAGTSLSVSGSALRQSANGISEGAPVAFSASIAESKPRTCHIFTFDAANAGSATVEIRFDNDETVTEEFFFELNEEA